MGTYRVFFRSGSNIVGRFDLCAKDDQAATALAETLCEACSDQCDAFEVWNGGHCICAGRTPRSLRRLDDIQEKTQASIVEWEETIQRSQWAIAGSQKLLARLNEGRAQTQPVGDRAADPAQHDKSVRQ
jgi:hypothetical protein